jgi:hypothetical protein
MANIESRISNDEHGQEMGVALGLMPSTFDLRPSTFDILQVRLSSDPFGALGGLLVEGS